MPGEPHNRKLSITKSNENSGGAFWSRADNRLGVQHLSFSIEADNAYPAHVHAEYVVFICLQGALTLNHFGETVVAGT
ncbi:MAG TPA: hypothetical protein VH280_03615, partial [Verrucomicrobiae bacterium]|nr:hypothetical protein [Verrucomicrobiae bacterium]